MSKPHLEVIRKVHSALPVAARYWANQWRTSKPGIEVAQKWSIGNGAQADWFCDSIWIWELNHEIILPLLDYWRNIFAQPLSLASTYLILHWFGSNIPHFEVVAIPPMEPAPVMVLTPVVVSAPMIPNQMSWCGYQGWGGQENRHRHGYRCRDHLTTSPLVNIVSSKTIRHIRQHYKSFKLLLLSDIMAGNGQLN